jgi:tRNA threonylcarbamoyladenosine biosynthesis protein TsaB
MTILCIETSTSVCSAAVCKDGSLIKQCINYEGSNHARLLPMYIEELLSFAREQHLSIDAVALSEGPGSYTGLRIGASTAKGLCYGLNVPLIPVPTLEVLCEASGVKQGRLIPMIDARRMEVYTMMDGETKAVIVENEDSLYAGDEDVYYFGDGAAKCQPVLTKPNWHYIPDIVPEAQYVGALAESGKWKVESVDLAYYEPFYLKEFIAAQSHVKGLK